MKVWICNFTKMLPKSSINIFMNQLCTNLRLVSIPRNKCILLKLVFLFFASKIKCGLNNPSSNINEAVNLDLFDSDVFLQEIQTDLTKKMNDIIPKECLLDNEKCCYETNLMFFEKYLILFHSIRELTQPANFKQLVRKYLVNFFSNKYVIEFTSESTEPDNTMLKIKSLKTSEELLIIKKNESIVVGNSNELIYIKEKIDLINEIYSEFSKFRCDFADIIYDKIEQLLDLMSSYEKSDNESLCYFSSQIYLILNCHLYAYKSVKTEKESDLANTLQYNEVIIHEMANKINIKNNNSTEYETKTIQEISNILNSSKMKLLDALDSDFCFFLKNINFSVNECYKKSLYSIIDLYSTNQSSNLNNINNNKDAFFKISPDISESTCENIQIRVEDIKSFLLRIVFTADDISILETKISQLKEELKSNFNQIGQFFCLKCESKHQIQFKLEEESIKVLCGYYIKSLGFINQFEAQITCIMEILQYIEKTRPNGIFDPNSVEFKSLIHFLSSPYLNKSENPICDDNNVADNTRTKIVECFTKEYQDQKHKMLIEFTKDAHEIVKSLQNTLFNNFINLILNNDKDNLISEKNYEPYISSLLQKEWNRELSSYLKSYKSYLINEWKEKFNNELVIFFGNLSYSEDGLAK